MAKKRKYTRRRGKGKGLRVTLIFFSVLLLSAGALFGFAWWGRHIGSIVATTVGGSATGGSVSGTSTEATADTGTTAAELVSSGGRVYLPLREYVSREGFEEAVNSAQKAGFTEVILDVKDRSGRIYFDSLSEVAASAGAVKPNSALVGMREIAAYLRSNGFKVYGRVSAFADDLTALTFPEYTLMREDGERFSDTECRWTNVYVKAAREYVLSIISEAAGLGLDGIILDSFYLPVTGEKLAPGGSDSPRGEVVEQFVSEARRRLDEVSPDIGLLLYLPVETQGKENVTGSNGQKLAALCDGVITQIS